MEILPGQTQIFIVKSPEDFNSYDDARVWAIENVGDFIIKKLPKKNKYRVYFEETISASEDPTKREDFVSFGMIVDNHIEK